MRLLLWLIAGLNVADAALTYYAVARLGFRETNPLFKQLMRKMSFNRAAAVMLAFKLVYIAGLFAVAHQNQGEWWMFAILVGTALLSGFAVVWAIYHMARFLRREK